MTELEDQVYEHMRNQVAIGLADEEMRKNFYAIYKLRQEIALLKAKLELLEKINDQSSPSF